MKENEMTLKMPEASRAGSRQSVEQRVKHQLQELNAVYRWDTLRQPETHLPKQHGPRSSPSPPCLAGTRPLQDSTNKALPATCSSRPFVEPAAASSVTKRSSRRRRRGAIIDDGALQNIRSKTLELGASELVTAVAGEDQVAGGVEDRPCTIRTRPLMESNRKHTSRYDADHTASLETSTTATVREHTLHKEGQRSVVTDARLDVAGSSHLANNDVRDTDGVADVADESSQRCDSVHPQASGTNRVGATSDAATKKHGDDDGECSLDVTQRVNPVATHPNEGDEGHAYVTASVADVARGSRNRRRTPSASESNNSSCLSAIKEDMSSLRKKRDSAMGEQIELAHVFEGGDLAVATGLTQGDSVNSDARCTTHASVAPSAAVSATGATVPLRSLRGNDHDEHDESDRGDQDDHDPRYDDDDVGSYPAALVGTDAKKNEGRPRPDKPRRRRRVIFDSSDSSSLEEAVEKETQGTEVDKTPEVAWDSQEVMGRHCVGDVNDSGCFVDGKNAGGSDMSGIATRHGWTEEGRDGHSRHITHCSGSDEADRGVKGNDYSPSSRAVSSTDDGAFAVVEGAVAFSPCTSSDDAEARPIRNGRFYDGRNQRRTRRIIDQSESSCEETEEHIDTTVAKGRGNDRTKGGQGRRSMRRSDARRTRGRPGVGTDVGRFSREEGTALSREATSPMVEGSVAATRERRGSGTSCCLVDSSEDGCGGTDGSGRVVVTVDRRIRKGGTLSKRGKGRTESLLTKAPSVRDTNSSQRCHSSGDRSSVGSSDSKCKSSQNEFNESGVDNDDDEECSPGSSPPRLMSPRGREHKDRRKPRRSQARLPRGRKDETRHGIGAGLSRPGFRRVSSSSSSDSSSDGDVDNVVRAPGKRRSPPHRPEFGGGRRVGRAEPKTRSSVVSRGEMKDLSGPAFFKARERLTDKYFQDFDQGAFGGLLSDVKVAWSQRLNSTAGVTKSLRRRSPDGCGNAVGEGFEYISVVELSSKVVDNESKLKETLLHELCHAAAWVIDHKAKPPHGEHFWAWANRAKSAHPGVPVTTCHSYEINYKYRYVCVGSSTADEGGGAGGGCGAEIGRHSKSIDVAKQVCGRCKGRLVLSGTRRRDGKVSKPRAASGFSLFVKENYAKVRATLPASAKHKDVMKAMSERWAARKTASQDQVDPTRGNTCGEVVIVDGLDALTL